MRARYSTSAEVATLVKYRPRNTGIRPNNSAATSPIGLPSMRRVKRFELSAPGLPMAITSPLKRNRTQPCRDFRGASELDPHGRYRNDANGLRQQSARMLHVFSISILTERGSRHSRDE